MSDKRLELPDFLDPDNNPLQKELLAITPERKIAPSIPKKDVHEAIHTEQSELPEIPLNLSAVLREDIHANPLKDAFAIAINVITGLLYNIPILREKLNPDVQQQMTRLHVLQTGIDELRKQILTGDVDYIIPAPDYTQRMKRQIPLREFIGSTLKHYQETQRILSRVSALTPTIVANIRKKEASAMHAQQTVVDILTQVDQALKYENADHYKDTLTDVQRLAHASMGHMMNITSTDNLSQSFLHLLTLLQQLEQQHQRYLNENWRNQTPLKNRGLARTEIMRNLEHAMKQANDLLNKEQDILFHRFTEEDKQQLVDKAKNEMVPLNAALDHLTANQISEYSSGYSTSVISLSEHHEFAQLNTAAHHLIYIVPFHSEYNEGKWILMENIAHTENIGVRLKHGEQSEEYTALLQINPGANKYDALLYQDHFHEIKGIRHGNWLSFDVTGYITPTEPNHEYLEEARIPFNLLKIDAEEQMKSTATINKIITAKVVEEKPAHLLHVLTNEEIHNVVDRFMKYPHAVKLMNNNAVQKQSLSASLSTYLTQQDNHITHGLMLDHNIHGHTALPVRMVHEVTSTLQGYLESIDPLELSKLSIKNRLRDTTYLTGLYTKKQHATDLLHRLLNKNIFDLRSLFIDKKISYTALEEALLNMTTLDIASLCDSFNRWETLCNKKTTDLQTLVKKLAVNPGENLLSKRLFEHYIPSDDLLIPLYQELETAEGIHWLQSVANQKGPDALVQNLLEQVPVYIINDILKKYIFTPMSYMLRSEEITEGAMIQDKDDIFVQERIIRTAVSKCCDALCNATALSPKTVDEVATDHQVIPTPSYNEIETLFHQIQHGDISTAPYHPEIKQRILSLYSEQEKSLKRYHMVESRVFSIIQSLVPNTNFKMSSNTITNIKQKLELYMENITLRHTKHLPTFIDQVIQSDNDLFNEIHFPAYKKIVLESLFSKCGLELNDLQKKDLAYYFEHEMHSIVLERRNDELSARENQKLKRYPDMHYAQAMGALRAAWSDSEILSKVTLNEATWGKIANQLKEQVEQNKRIEIVRRAIQKTYAAVFGINTNIVQKVEVQEVTDNRLLSSAQSKLPSLEDFVKIVQQAYSQYNSASNLNRHLLLTWLMHESKPRPKAQKEIQGPVRFAMTKLKLIEEKQETILDEGVTKYINPVIETFKDKSIDISDIQKTMERGILSDENTIDRIRTIVAGITEDTQHDEVQALNNVISIQQFIRKKK